MENKLKTLFFSYVGDWHSRWLFLKSIGEEEEAKALALAEYNRLYGASHYETAIRHAEQYQLFDARELTRRAKEACLLIPTKGKYCDAIDLAKSFQLYETASVLARKSIEEGLAGANWSMDTYIDLCKKYIPRGDEISKRVYRRHFADKVKDLRYHSDLLKFVEQNREYFTDDEEALAKQLTEKPLLSNKLK